MPWSPITSIDLDAAASTKAGLLATAHLVTTNLLQSFGLAEALQFDTEGRIRLKYVGKDLLDETKRWDERNNVEVLEG